MYPPLHAWGEINIKDLKRLKKNEEEHGQSNLLIPPVHAACAKLYTRKRTIGSHAQ